MKIRIDRLVGYGGAYLVLKEIGIEVEPVLPKDKSDVVIGLDETGDGYSMKGLVIAEPCLIS